MSRKNNKPHIICITGTDTDAGKTLVTAGLLRAINGLGKPVQAIKAVQTGCISSENGLTAPDVAIYRRAAPGACCMALATFIEPCSPHLAASLEGKELKLASLLDRIQAEAASFDGLTLLEGAGGLLVPLNERECFIDLFERLGAPIVLVAPNRLGTINHSLLSLEAIRARSLEIQAVVLSKTEDQHSPSPLARQMEKDTPAIISKLAKIPRPVCLPYFQGIHSSGQEQATEAWNDVCEHLLPTAKAICGI